MSNGTIVNHIKKLSFNLEEILNKVKDKILNSRKMYTDATTSRCNSRNISVRNYSTDDYTLLCATNTKSKIKGNHENTSHSWNIEMIEFLNDLNNKKKELILNNINSFTQDELNYYSPSLNSNLKAGK